MLLRHEAQHSNIALSYANCFFSVAARSFVLWHGPRAKQVAWYEKAALLVPLKQKAPASAVLTHPNRAETTLKEDALGGGVLGLPVASTSPEVGDLGSSLGCGTRRLYIYFSASPSPLRPREELDWTICSNPKIWLWYWYTYIDNKY